jgi:Xaa-Pro aminopeptidase
MPAVVVSGALWKDIDAAARHVLLDHLIQMGLVKGSVDQLMKAKVDRVFMPHGLGHHLGLDVHDMADEGPVPVKLQPGYVVTCEPGCYFMPMLIDRALADKNQVSSGLTQSGGWGNRFLHAWQVDMPGGVGRGRGIRRPG